MNELTVQQILERLSQEGIGFSLRTFEYYQDMKLLPKPLKKVPGKGGKGVYGYYGEDILDLIKAIRSLQAKGMKLKDIKNHIDREMVADKLITESPKVFKDWLTTNRTKSLRRWSLLEASAKSQWSLADNDAVDIAFVMGVQVAKQILVREVALVEDTAVKQALLGIVERIQRELDDRNSLGREAWYMVKREEKKEP